MQAEADLHRFLLDFGGARQTEDDPRDLLYGISLRAARLRARSFLGWKNIRGEPLVIACGYAQAREMNAVAGREGGTHCAAVFEPLVGAFFDFFTALLSIPGFVPEIGEPAREDKARLLQRRSTLGFGYLTSAAETDPARQLDHLTLPRCPVRALTALHMAHVAFDFVWSHEMWHSAMGHVDYASTLNVLRLHERPGEGCDARLLPLEEEADRLATFWIADQAFQQSTPYLPLAMKPTPLQRVMLIRLTLALTAFFWAHLQRIDESLNPADESNAESSHPPPLMRLHLALQNVDKFISQRRGVTPHQLADLDDLFKRELQRLAADAPWFRKLDPDIVFAQEALGAAKRVQESLRDRYVVMSTGVEFFAYSKG